MIIPKCQEMQVEWMQQAELHSSLTEMVACSPVNCATVRKTRPYPNQVLKCPRCDSFNTKFCYYNNYSLTQPRHFCKNCKRYWTKGGALRNVPPGGGCRKNKRSKLRITDQQQRVATITVGEGRGEGSGSIEKIPNKILCYGPDTTVSGDNSSAITSATNAPTRSSIDGSPSPNTPLPQVVIGNCACSGYLKLPPDGEEPVTILFDGINSSSEGSPKAPRSASSAFLVVAGDQEEERVWMLLDAEQNFNGCSMFDAVKGRTQQQKFSVSPFIYNRQESSNLPVFFPCNSIPHLDGLSSLDSTLLASNISTSEILKKADQSFMHNSGDDVETRTFETPSHRMYDVSPVSPTESIIVSSIGPNMRNCSNLVSHGRLQDCEQHRHLQQQVQEEERFSVMPANQIPMDEQTWRRMIEGASVENFNQMRDNFSISDSQTLLYDVGSVGHNWPICSEEYFDPTDDQCYMGGPEVWHDIPAFDIGTGTPI